MNAQAAVKIDALRQKLERWIRDVATFPRGKQLNIDE